MFASGGAGVAGGVDDQGDEVGLLDRSKRGVWVYYAVRREALADLGALIGGVAATAG